MHTLSLQHTTLEFNDFFSASGLQQLDSEFLAYLQKANSNLFDHLHEYRHNQLSLSTTQTSDFLIALATYIERFLAQLFAIEIESQASQQKTQQKNPIGLFRKEFILTKVKRLLHKPDEFASFSLLHTALLRELNVHHIDSGDLEHDVATLGLLYLNNTEIYGDEIERLAQWCVQALRTTEGRVMTENWDCLRFPEKLDHEHLIPTTAAQRHGTTQQALPEKYWRERDGFSLTDTGMSDQAVQNEIHYCIYCHDHDGDFCSKGFPNNKKEPSAGYKKNPLNTTLTGCPLEERISEMHVLKRDGWTIGALAMVMLDNPMCPATGHRICNDCMKACIYQKQTPVNIPQIETRVLTDVLALPWGVEIYDLLTKWNPLRQQQWIMRPYNGKKIMIAGMGPAGFTLAHHLLQEGCAVVGFDGLKIEPLPTAYITQPIRDYQNIVESLDERLVAGFGGVAEYGITVRWDKNFLKLIYISLMRRPHFQVFGNVRFGGTVTIEDAWDLGFDHFVIAVGAGLPKALPIKNSMAAGMRQANDFLMALQLTGAAKKNSFSALEIRLPVVVIGGGLTGVDAATEAQAYYVRQVEKIAERYEKIKTLYSREEILAEFSLSSYAILQEFLTHAELIAEERQRANRENRKPQFIRLLHQWGGVTIVYRQRMQQSPAYINNHEELHKALEEGIFYSELLSPLRVNVDEHDYCCSITCTTQDNSLVTLPAKSILVATGASLNVAYSFEHPHVLERKSMQYLSYEEKNGELYAAHGAEHCKDRHIGPFTSYHDNNKHRVSFIGDTHPIFHGNVVKAIASAKYTYPKIMQHLLKQNDQNGQDYPSFKEKIRHQFTSIVLDIRYPEDGIVAIDIHSAQAIKHYRPGNFYRIQTFETDKKISHEAPWLFASDVDSIKNILTFTLTTKEARQSFLDHLVIGNHVALMGPTGVRSKISENHDNILIIANEKNLSHVHSYAKALKDLGNGVVCIGYSDNQTNLFYQKEIESICDLVFWTEDCIETLKNYADTKNAIIPLQHIDRIQVIGNSTQLKEIVRIQKEYLQEKLPTHTKITASVHGQMQCMLKGVCAQCLQWQVDPDTGERTKAVFACSWQDQPIELIDLNHLAVREKQNDCQKTINRLFLAKK